MDNNNKPEIEKARERLYPDKAEEITEKTVSDILNILNIVKKGKKVYVYVLPNEIEYYDAKEISNRAGKEAVVFRVNDEDKYDPQDKAKKAKPGRPAIYIE